MNGWQYDHDAPNRLVSVTGNGHSASFTYDGLGRCVPRIVDGQTTLFVYDGWKPVTEYDAAGNLYARNIYGPGADEILMRGSPSGWFFYHADKQGSVSALVDLSGNVAERYKYDAFGKPKIMDGAGNERPTGTAVGNRFLFTGREWIKELGIYDYRHRFYHPGLGRFIQTDPTGFDAGDMNLFRYCADDPVNRTDPTGLQDFFFKPNLTSLGQGDWMRLGSPFTNGELLTKAQNYVREITSIVDKAVDKANKHSPNVKWSASIINSLKSRQDFKNPSAVATTAWSPKSTAIMNADAVGSFNVNLQININWNESRAASFGMALRTDNGSTDWRGRTGEIAHTRDFAKALNFSYGGARSATVIANEQAASMVGQTIPEGVAASRMDDALSGWALQTMAQSKLDRDKPWGEHWY